MTKSLKGTMKNLKTGLTGFVLITTLVTVCKSTGPIPVNTGSSSHLGAFKQLGFDFPTDNHASSDGRKTPFIPYSISSYNNNNNENGNDKIVSSWNEESKAEKFQQIRHPNDILTNMGVKLPSDQILGDVPIFTAVQGSSVDLPCNITPPIFTDRVRLVLYFRNDSAIPIYTYDTRGQSHAEARHWSDENVLGGRAFFRGDLHPARLVIENVQGIDAGVYRCRADFYRAPTTINHMRLDVIVPPEKPKIFDERGQEVRLKLGPYKIGDTVALKCVANGGRPHPRVSWWRDHALLDDVSEEINEFESKVVNELRLVQLRREDLHSILTCQASNNNMSIPASTSVKLDMHFGPLNVQLLDGKDPVSAGRPYEFRCQSVGARPPPIITWWKGSIQLRDNVTSRTSPDGNVTLSTLNYVPSVRDAGKFMACRAENPEVPDATLEDGWKVEIHYVPQVVLGLGSSLNGTNIKEGDDVYFECNIRASPKPYKISWRFNDIPLGVSPMYGIIISNQSLVLQNVKRDQSGMYTCVAHNIEGDGVSNPVNLNIRYAPYCKPDQVQVFGVAREETARISCEVMANPQAYIYFEWRFNTTGEMVDMPHDRFRSTNTHSVVEYVPRTEMDYGSLLCWATNSVGRQKDPCIFHLVPAGVPDALKKCIIGNQTTSSLHLTCLSGYDGGLPQSFVLEAKDSHTLAIVAKVQSHIPYFNITGLQAGSSYVLTVYSQNSKGQSSPVTIYAFTTKEAERHIAGSTLRGNGGPGSVEVTPVLRILVAIGCGLALVAVSLIIVLKVRPAFVRRKRREAADGMSTRGTSFAPGTHIALSQRDTEDEIEEKDPDVIPANKELIEEEEAFHNYHEHRSATLGRRPMSLTNCTSGKIAETTLVQGLEEDDEYFERIRGIKNNFSRLSQEVTYAELTMPRNKGYTPMRADSRNLTDSPINGTTSCCVTASVRYAKIDATAARPRPPRTVRPPKPDPPPRYTSPPSSTSITNCNSVETSCNVTSQSGDVVALPQQFGVSTAASLQVEAKEKIETKNPEDHSTVQESPLVIFQS